MFWIIGKDSSHEFSLDEVAVSQDTESETPSQAKLLGRSDRRDFVGRDNGTIALVLGNKGRSKAL